LLKQKNVALFLDKKNFHLGGNETIFAKEVKNPLMMNLMQIF